MEYTKGNWERHNRLYGNEVTEHIWCGEKHIADFDGDNATANAKLCVAAPDLYEALKLYENHQQGTSGHYCWKCAEAIKKALAKAEGR